MLDGLINMTTWTKINKPTGTSYTKVIKTNGSSRYGFAKYGTNKYGATGISWTNVPKASIGPSIPVGSPMGLLLSITYSQPVIMDTTWTKINKAT